jgi:hypothetical protein
MPPKPKKEDEESEQTTVNARVFGVVEPFDPKKDKWQVYQARLEQYFVANDVTNEGKKKAVLLTVAGRELCDLLWDLCIPDQPTDDKFTFTKLCDILAEHLVPATVEIAERFVFYRRKQQPSESVIDFMTALRNLSRNCEFGSFLKSALRDAFVLGIQDHRIQSRLLTEKKLSVDSALQIAVSMETAAAKTKQIRESEGATAGVNFVQSRQHPCRRCGKTNHRSEKCFFADAECHYCHKQGHIAVACMAKKSMEEKRESTPVVENKFPKSQSKQVNFAEMEECASEGEDLLLYALTVQTDEEDAKTYTLTDKDKDPIQVTPRVNGSPLKMEVDTGCPASLVAESEWERLGQPKLGRCGLKFKSYSGHPVQVLGYFTATVEYNHQCQRFPLVVVRGDRPNLCGRNWMRLIRLDWNNIFNVKLVLEELNPVTELCNEELGTIKAPVVNLRLKPGTKASFHQARPIPYAFRGKAKEEVIKIKQPGILKRGPHSEGPIPARFVAPWTRLHIGYVGPVNGKMILVIVDATSKWPEIFSLTSTTSTATINALRGLFARYGVPEQVITDSGPQFSSSEFEEFMKRNGVLHKTEAPSHLQRNGLLERLVQSVKSALKKMESQPGTLAVKIWRFLMSYRNKPHSSTGKSPAAVFLGRPLRTRLDLLKPMTKAKDRNVPRVFTSGQAVLVRDYRAGTANWQSGIIEDRIGTYFYKVRVGQFSLKRHVDQILRRQPGPSGTEDDGGMAIVRNSE